MENPPIPIKNDYQHLWSVPVIVAALGYFVDIYDLLLFGIVRVPSLKALGLSETEVSSIGTSILNYQMTGLLIGGIFWGILGDKKGRLSVLFGSIVTYSLANIACGFVMDPTVYKWLRLLAGIGLAGELGAGITLVSEILPKQIRAIGTSLVAAIGLLGAVVGYFTVQLFDWRIAYFVGGGMGIVLLLLRMNVFESAVFEKLKSNNQIKKGHFGMLFNSKKRFITYIKCIGIGVPTWFVIGIMATFSNEIGAEMGLQIQPGLSILWAYVGLSIGDLASGLISQFLKSRKKAVLYMMLFTLAINTLLIFITVASDILFYLLMLLLGLGIGYWAMFVTIGAEQFGTNIRATAATTIPNMVRGTVVLMTMFFSFLKNNTFSILESCLILMIICFFIGIFSILTIPETHDKDLDFIDE